MIVAFDIQLGGTRRAITSIDDLTRALKQAERQATTSKFGSRRLEEATIAASKLKAALSQIKQQDTIGTSIAKSAFAATGSLRQATAAVVALRAQYAALNSTDKAGTLGRDIARNLKDAEAHARSMRRELSLAAAESRRITTPLSTTRVGRGIGGLVPGVGGNITGNLLGTGAGVIGGASLGLIAIAALAATQNIVKLNAEVDDLLGILQKTGDLTREKTQALLEPLIALDTRTTLKDLLKIGEVLGKLGIDINERTIGVVNDLTIALSDEFTGGTEETTDALGKLRNILGEFRGTEASQAFLKIGNALNVLGASGAATAPVIANFASRIGGVSGPLGVTAAQIFGVSASLQELGTTAERGSSGFNRIISKIASSPEKFAKVLQITDEQIKAVDASATSFADLVNKDIFGAFSLVLQRIKDLNLSTTDFVSTLGVLKIKGQGEREVIGKLSQSYELLQNRVSLANGALQNGDSIAKEVSVRNETLQAQLERLGNTIQEGFVSSGLTDWLRDSVGGLNDLLGASKGLSEQMARDIVTLNSLVTEALSYNETTTERARVIGALQEQYPEYFANLNQETATNEELIAVLNRANDAYVKRFGLISLQEDFTAAQEEQGKKQAKLAKAQATLFESLGIAVLRFERDTGKSFARTGNALADAQRLIEEGGGLRLSLTRSLGGDITRVKLAQEALNDAVKEATTEQNIYTNALRIFAQEEVKATAQAGQRVLKYKEEALAQKAVIAGFAERGEKEKALAELAQLKLRAENALAAVNTREVDFVAKLADSQLVFLAESAKNTANEVVKIANDAESLLKGKGEAALPPAGDEKSTARKAASESKRDRDAAKRALEAFNKELGDLEKDLNNQRLDAISNSSDDQRRLALLGEQRRFEEQKQKIVSGQEDLLRAAKEAKASIAEAVASSEEELKALISSGASKKAISTARENLNKELEIQKKALVEFAKIDPALGIKGGPTGTRDKVFVTQQALLTEHRIKEKAINDRFDEQDAKDREKAATDTYQQLRLFYDKIENQSIEDADKRSKEIIAARLKAEEDFLNGVTNEQGISPKKALKGLKTIDLQFDEQELENQKTLLLRRLELLQQALSDALAQDELSYEVTGSIVFNPKDIEKLRDDIQKIQGEITANEQKEANNRIKIKREEKEKELELERRYKDAVIDTAFDILQKGSDASFEIRQRQLDKEKELSLTALEDEFVARQNAVKNNAIETERVEKQKAEAIEKLEREAAKRSQELAIQQAEIDGALAIIKILATIANPFLAAVAITGVIATTAIQIGKIKSFDEGGGTGLNNLPKDKTGHRPAGVVHVNEYVIPEKVRNTPEGMLLENRLERLRRNHGYRSAQNGYYASGGASIVTAPVGASSSVTSLVVNTEVTLNDDQIRVLGLQLEESVRNGALQGTLLGANGANKLAEREANLKTQLQI